MKTIRFIPVCCILALLLITGCDKYEVSDDQRLSFIKYYGPTAENEGVDIHKTSDGYLIIGNSNLRGNNGNIVVFTTDEYGNLTSNIKTLGSSNNDKAIKAVPVEGGNFLICARTSQSEDNRDLYLIKISQTGEVLWENRYAKSNNNEGLDAVLLNNQYVVVGYATNDDGIRQSWSVRLTTSGSLINERTITGSEDQQIVSIYANNGQAYVLGHIRGQPGNPNNYDLFHAELSETGRLFGINYYNTFNSNNQNMNEFAVDMTGDDNNRLILGYYEHEGRTVPFLVNYTRLDNTFQKNWELFIREDNIENVNSLSVQGNDILVLANSSETPTGHIMQIFRTSVNATTYTLSFFGEEEALLRGNKILHLPDGHVGLVGSSRIGDNSSIMLLKLRSDMSLQ